MINNLKIIDDHVCGKKPQTLHLFPRNIEIFPITFGISEIDYLCEHCEGYENVSEDRGAHEVINRPDLYGYYKSNAFFDKRGDIIPDGKTYKQIGMELPRMDSPEMAEQVASCRRLKAGLAKIRFKGEE